MPNEHTDFWIALLNLGKDQDRRARLWNGYLGWKLPSRVKGKFDPKGGWPQLIVDPPEGGWPELTDDERQVLDTMAKENGGHPELVDEYMNFSGHAFSHEVDLSDLILVHADFSNAIFPSRITLSDKTQFYSQTRFCNANFSAGLSSCGARFHTHVSFSGSRFEHTATFVETLFMGGASFKDALFYVNAMFNDSQFEERYFSGGITLPVLADFRNAKFPDGASFRAVVFGRDESAYSRKLWPERRADFSGAEFGAATSFRWAVFAGAPAFFNTTLHEDTDFGRVDWSRAETTNISADYAVRAWERLELMMSRLEKPLDRHQFFRLKMRARRRTEGRVLRTLNWLFEKTSDYGWGVGRASACWLGHWLIASLVLFANSDAAASGAERWRLALAALGTGFANAHAFLFLTAEGGHLESARKLLEECERYAIMTRLGTLEAVLGPILLFFLLLTLRNRFRLA
ncbi:MAG: hypothetical protein OXI66_16365 [Boseongicola sp.]|nr:hypothetical protein [Boseongicola sp.]